MEQIQYGPSPTEYLSAMRTVRLARAGAWALATGAVALQIAAFVAVQFFGVADAPASAATRAAAAIPATPPAAARPAGDGSAPTTAASQPTTRRSRRPATDSAPASAPAPIAAASAPATTDSAARAGGPSSPAATGTGAGPGSGPAKKPPADAPDLSHIYWQHALARLLPVSQFVGMLAAGLLALTLLLAVLVSLGGRLVGVGGFLGAMFWSLVLLLAMIPWQVAFGGETPFAGATFGYSELVEARAGWLPVDAVTFYGRFLAYPLVAMGLCLLVAIRFGGAYRQMTAARIQPPAEKAAG